MKATLYRLKPRFQDRLRPLVRRSAEVGVRPNHLTLGAVGASVLAGGAVALSVVRPALLWLVPVLYLTRMALNAMDGLLAREHDMTTPAGAILNEVGDVVSDAVAYLPFVLVVPGWAWLVVVDVVLGLVGEVTALAAAGGGERRNHGPLGKSDRAFAFGTLAVAVALGLQWLAGPLLLIMAALGVMTIWNRGTAMS